MNNVHKELGFNWNQTGLHLVTTGQWTIHEAKSKMVPVMNSDDKWQITAVLATTMTGEFLPPQLIFKGETLRYHPTVAAPQSWEFWHSANHGSDEESTCTCMLRCLGKVIFPFVEKRERN